MIIIQFGQTIIFVARMWLNFILKIIAGSVSSGSRSRKIMVGIGIEANFSSFIKCHRNAKNAW